jgi:hypothetical protein
MGVRGERAGPHLLRILQKLRVLFLAAAKLAALQRGRRAPGGYLATGSYCARAPSW